ncbi:MAG TPA: outer membrane beta-barrel protein [Steroidobacteraceae bacterium]|nr:outer membrane beta-barrel protein [Steroidobacteraceae bacterium]
MTKKFLPLAAPLLAIAGVAGAAGLYSPGSDYQPYVGANVGLLRYNESGLPTVSPSMIIGRIGLPVSSYFGIEARIGTGLAGDNSGGAAVNVNTIGGAYVKGSWPILPTFSVYGVAGLGTLSLDRNFGDGRTTNTGLSYGVGGDVALRGPLGINFEWTHFPGGSDAGFSYNSDVFSAGVTWRF